MATQINSVVNEIKKRIISGHYRPGERLVELQLVNELGVSRTPIRLAFEELAKDGLVERLPTRGFRVKSFNAQNLGDAIDVRGTLEGMVARLVAEKGADSRVMHALYGCLEEGQQLLEQAALANGHLDARQWMVINSKFHDTLIQAANNKTLAETIAFTSRIPMAAANALSIHGAAPKLEFEFISRAHRDHCDVVTAIECRESSRAEFIMREHARKTRDNKKQILSREIQRIDLGTNDRVLAPSLPEA